MGKNKLRIRELWNNFKHPKIHVTGVPKEEREKRIEKIPDELLAEKFSNFMKVLTQAQEI